MLGGVTPGCGSVQPRAIWPHIAEIWSRDNVGRRHASGGGEQGAAAEISRQQRNYVRSRPQVWPAASNRPWLATVENTDSLLPCIAVSVDTSWSSDRAVCRLADRMALKSTQKRTASEIGLALHKIGASLVTMPFRDCNTQIIHALHSDTKLVFDILSESFQNTTFKEEELLKEIRVLEIERDSALSHPETLVSELAHTTAFAGSVLGMSQYPTSAELRAVTPRHLANFVQQTIPDRVAITTVGLQCSEAVRRSKAFFKKPISKTADKCPSATQKYMGGDKTLPIEDMKPMLAGNKAHLVHVGLGFEGVSMKDSDFIAACALVTLLGGGSSFSEGGPGKGLLTRLYTNVLCHDWVESAYSAHFSFRDTGMFLLQGSCSPTYTPRFLLVLLSELLKLKDIEDEEFKRMINAIKHMMFSANESDSVHACDLNRQLLMRSSYMSQSDVLDFLSTLTKESVVKFATKLLESKPTLVLVGPRDILRNMPNANDLHNALLSLRKNY
ncbi:mitochondrial processing peptidase subunit alpha [Pelomyxa schiedti]|nr:mitochondrial processing peptidase subunit alpha [Pelomyxa schiedti]